MFDDRELAESCIRRFTQDHLVPRVHQERAEVTITAHRLDGEPIPPREATARDCSPLEVGAPLGRAWSTTWLHATDLRERPFDEDAPAFRSALGREEDGTVQLTFRPFEVKTLRIARGRR